MGELQQLVNLSKEAKEAWDDAAVDAAAAARTSRQLFQVTFDGSRLRREWETLWQQFAADLSTTLLPVVNALTYGFKAINAAWPLVRENINFFAGIATGGLLSNVLGKAQPGQSNFTQALTQFNRPSVNQWQRMGFVMNGGPAGNEQVSLLRDIVKNTGAMAGTLISFVNGAASGNPISMVQSLRNMP